MGREDWEVLATLAELAMRARIGGEAYDRLYDGGGNRRPMPRWQPEPARAEPETVALADLASSDDAEDDADD